MQVVSARDLTMTYRVPVRDAGLRAALASLLRPRYRGVPAVRSVSFEIGEAEVVGFIGPNGAGKTTTLKMLSGVLHPTAGDARVLGFTPWRRSHDLLRQIAFIRGSRPLGVSGELTVLDALRFQRLVYAVPERQFRLNLDELTDLLDLGPLLERQTRALSLGERMRAGLACSLLYRPRVLFLDEPTIGLDVSAATLVRRFIADYRERVGAAILLTSHYMADVETLCRRIVLIDRGQLVYDGDVAELAARLAPYKLLKVVLPEALQAGLEAFGEVVSREGEQVSVRVPRDGLPEVVARLLAEMPVADLAVEEPPLEVVIDRVYREGVAA